ncbi:UNVERIFIED_CONTAM: hypothetical protein K2H54_054556 [Gekko kuhli]
MSVATMSHFKPFDPKVGNWESYPDCFECYLVANVTPSKLLAVPLDEIKTKLKEYFKPKTSAAIHCFAFHQQSQQEGESITDYVTAL